VVDGDAAHVVVGDVVEQRGRVGSYYALAADVGCALTVSIAPEGIVAETIDVRSHLLARAVADVPRPASSAVVGSALRAVVARVRDAAGAGIRLAAVSAADPVDRATGRLVQLPDTPFLVGDLDATAILGELVNGPVMVDNDVNWAALAERSDDKSSAMDNFVYIYLGEGLGAAVVSDGEVRRGHAGMSGEIAHLVTTGTSGRAVPFTEVFRELGVRHAGSTAIDVDGLLAAVTATGPAGRKALDTVASAICGVLAAAVALTDPGVIVLGGSWGGQPTVLDAVGAAFARHPRHVPLRAATVTTEAPLTGAAAGSAQSARRHHRLPPGPPVTGRIGRVLVSTTNRPSDRSEHQ
jgi:predicted NBD/HSP70 family sugar kinase